MNKNIKNRILSLGMISCMVLGLLGPCSDIFYKEQVVQAADDDYFANTSDAVGTSGNPFRILEIVPDLSWGKLRYYVGGQEKFNTKTTEFTDAEIAELETAGLVNSNSVFSVDKKEVTNTFTGYYIKGTDTTQYKKSTADRYTPVTAGSGTYVAVVNSFTYVGENKGNYAPSFTYDTVSTGVTRYKIDTVTSSTVGSYKKKNVYVNDTASTKVVSFIAPGEDELKELDTQRYRIVFTDVDASNNPVADANGHYVYDAISKAYKFMKNPGGQTAYSPLFVADADGEYVYEDTFDATAAYGDNYKYTRNNVYVYVADNKGDKNITFVKDTTGEYTVGSENYALAKGDYKATISSYTASATGNYTKKTVEAFVKDSAGEYKWVTAASNPGGDTYWYENEEFTYDTNFLVNNELFKNKVLGDTDKYVQVITVTPKMLSANVDNASTDSTKPNNLLDVADFIYISDAVDTTKYVMLYGKTGKSVVEDKKYNYYYNSDTDMNDITWNTAYKIMQKVAVNKVPLFIDYSTADYNKITSGTKVRMLQLPMMCSLYGAAEFYNYFINQVNGESNAAIKNNGKYNDSTNFTDQMFISNNEEIQNLLGIRMLTLTVDNTSNNYEYSTSVLENVYLNNNTLFKNVLSKNFMTEQYNYTDKKKNGFSSITDSKSAANIFKYLIGYKGSNPNVNKDEFNILEVQPCYDFAESSNMKLKGYYPSGTKASGNSSFLTNESEKLYRYCRRLMPNYFGKFSHTKLISSAFNGHIEDLVTSYDLIYFGLNTGKMNTDSSSDTVYNDTRMNGLIYTHVGDRFIAGAKLSGCLYRNNTINSKPTVLQSESEYSLHSIDSNALNSIFSGTEVITTEAYRLSGNDVSSSMKARIEEYIEDGYAILAENALVDCKNAKIDDSSNMYKVFKDKSGVSNIADFSKVATAEPNSETVKKLVTSMVKSKVRINMASCPEKYEVNNSNEITYNTGNGLDSNTISYKFSIDDIDATASTRYTAHLIVDSNADGYYDNTDSADTEVIKIMTDLKKGTTYSINQTLNQDYTGIIPWKLLIFRQDNESIRGAESGYTCIPVTDTDNRTVIRVLQITSTKGNDNMDMEEQYYGKGKMLHDLTTVKNLPDFEFIIDSISVDNYVKLYEKYGNFSYNGTYVKDNNTNNFMCNTSYKDTNRDLSNAKIKELHALFGDEYKNYSKLTEKQERTTDNYEALKTFNYDMVLMGFADCYKDFYSTSATEAAKESAVKNLQYFIDSGRGVMFSHDTTSFVNYNFNTTNTKDFYENGLAGKTNGKNSKNYWPLSGVTNWGFSINRYLRGRLGTDRFNVLKNLGPNYEDLSTKGHKYDTASMPSTVISKGTANTDKQYKEIQGYGYCGLRGNLWWTANGDYNNKFKDNYGKYVTERGKAYVQSTLNKYDAYKGSTDLFNDGNTTTTKVTKVNDGQITNYPYELKPEIDVSQTHGPYYQLNMEEDNVVVWYCLGKSSDSGSNCYGYAPNDVTNYYYIYSMGNIMYTGSGHTNFEDKENEVKLFINTMIAAYVPEKTPSSISIGNSANVTEIDGENVNIVYTHSDYANERNIIDTDATGEEKYMDVKIQFSNYNLGRPEADMKIVALSGSTENSIAGLKVEGGAVYEEGKYSILKAEDYLIKVPISNIQDKDDFTIKIYVTPEDESGTVSTKVRIVRRSLFDLK